jgi:cardiolipin synthase
VEVLPFHPFQWTNPNLYFHRDHRKLVVIDGWVGFTGGLNVGDEYRGYLRKKLAGWRDTGVKVKGPIAQAMLEAFQKSWKKCGGRAIEENFPGRRGGTEQDVSLLPLFSSSRKSMRALRQLLQFSVHAARRSIHLTMAYFIPTRKFLRVLLKAARRGVDVQIILPGQSDLRLVAYVSRTYYKTLLREGVRIFHYQPRVLHAKTMVFDGYWSIVGSANLDSRSLNYNYECGVGILDSRVAEEMERIFARDLMDSRPITAEDLFRWPLHERALGTCFSWFRSYL